MLSTTGWTERAGSILERLGAYRAYLHVRDHNPSNRLPYHNWTHLCHVVVNSHRGAEHYALPARDQANLAVAGIFHDYDHSGGVTDDQQNVDRAIANFQEWSSTQSHPTWDDAEVELLIRTTQWPPVVDPISITQKIMRDADLMENGLDTWEELIMNGVRFELEVKEGVPITLEDMKRRQVEYHRGVQWNTAWGRRFAREHIWPILDQLDKPAESM